MREPISCRRVRNDQSLFQFVRQHIPTVHALLVNDPSKVPSYLRLKCSLRRGVWLRNVWLIRIQILLSRCRSVKQRHIQTIKDYLRKCHEQISYFFRQNVIKNIIWTLKFKKLTSNELNFQDLELRKKTLSNKYNWNLSRFFYWFISNA